MEREINLKFLWYELIKKWKIIVSVGIIVAIFVAIYMILEERSAEPTYNYGAFAKITVEKDEVTISGDIDDKITSIDEFQDYSEKYISIITSDKVIQQIINDNEYISAKSDLSTIRGMIYPRGRTDGSIIELNIVAADQNFATLLCENLLLYGTEALEAKNLETEIIQNVTEIGAVSVEISKSTEDPRDSISVITPVTLSHEMSILDVLTKLIIGFLFGLLFVSLCICGIFILRNRIVYAEQLKDATGIELISDFNENRNYWELYSAVNLDSVEIKVINFISLKELKKNKSFVEEFAQLIGMMDKKVALINYNQGIEKNYEIIFKNNQNYSSGEINDALILKKNYLKEKISELIKTYDYVLFVCDGIDNCPIGKLISKEVDKTIVLVEANTVRAKELADIHNSYKHAGMEILGTVLIS